MLPHKADIFSQLQQEILRAQGYKRLPASNKNIPPLGPIDAAFPNQTFPLAAIHEFLTVGKEDLAASYGFISVLLSSLMRNKGPAVWLTADQAVFAPGLNYFGINPDKIIFINAVKEKEKLWLIEEALKCEGLAAVIGELNQLSFAASRRFQLAVEKSCITGLIINQNSKLKSRLLSGQNASAVRWRISSLHSLSSGLPGIGFPAWNVELVKVRNGKTGFWNVHWSSDHLVISQLPIGIGTAAGSQQDGHLIIEQQTA